MREKNSLSHLVALHLVAILFVISNVSDIRIAGLSSLIPLFDLMMVFYFTVFRNIFAVWFIFLLGIWNDALNGNPIGLTAICYILLVKFFLLANSKMLIKEEFRQIWQQFVVFCFLFLLMKWILLSIFNGAFYSVTTPFIQLVLSSSFYVLMHKFFNYLDEKLLKDSL
jgi:cell shape-determining protein MreD